MSVIPAAPTNKDSTLQRGMTSTHVLPSHLRAVDGLRGLAALIILVYHSFTAASAPEFRPWHHLNLFRPLHDGWAGVNLFLVLSGFCLCWPYAKNPTRQLHISEFMRRRVLRIVPAYYASLVFVILVYLIITRVLKLPVHDGSIPHGLLDVILHLSLLQALTGATIYSWNPVTWSLSLEWMWYLAFPLAIWLYRRFGANLAFSILTGINLIYRIGLYIHFGPSSHYSANYELCLRTFLFGRLFEFGIGMYVAYWLARKEISPSLERGCLIALPIVLIAARGAESVDAFLPVRDMLYGLASALLLLVAISPRPGLAQRILGGKFLYGVGQYSYSLYLFHLSFLVAWCVLLRQAGFTGPKEFLSALAISPLILVFARLAYLVFEAPSLKLRGQNNTVPRLSHSPPETTFP